MTTTRRGFIGGTVGAAIAGAAEATPAPRPPYDLAAVEARLRRPSRHRQVFAVARVADGAAIGLMRHALDAYEGALSEGPGTLHVAGVFYARGVVLMLDDAAWRTYRLAEALRRRGDAPVRDAGGNPYWDRDTSGTSLRGLVLRGASYFACDNALLDWAGYLVETGTTDRSLDQVHADLRARLVKGAMLVPAGVAALNMAQEAHFTFVQASL